MEAKKFKLVVKLCSVLSAIAVFALVITAVVQFAQMGALARKKSKLQKELDYLSATESSIKETLAKHDSLDYTEQYAREHLGFVEDGDIIYEIN